MDASEGKMITPDMRSPLPRTTSVMKTASTSKRTPGGAPSSARHSTEDPILQQLQLLSEQVR